VEADVKILLLVPNCTWVSRPITASQANWVPAGFAISREHLRITQSYETEAVEQLFFHDTTKTTFNGNFTIATMAKDLRKRSATING
jgi:negative regulator of sigma E activity